MNATLQTVQAGCTNQISFVVALRTISTSERIKSQRIISSNAVQLNKLVQTANITCSEQTQQTLEASNATDDVHGQWSSPLNTPVTETQWRVNMLKQQNTNKVLFAEMVSNSTW